MTSGDQLPVSHSFDADAGNNSQRPVPYRSPAGIHALACMILFTVDVNSVHLLDFIQDEVQVWKYSVRPSA